MIPTPGARGIWVSVRVLGWIDFHHTGFHQMGIQSHTQIHTKTHISTSLGVWGIIMA
jgi:hypothetical protein